MNFNYSINHIDNSKINKIKLLYVARLEKRKRHEWCINAFEYLYKNGFHVELNIVGNGSCHYAKHIKNMIQNLENKYCNSIKLYSNISNHELNNLYITSDIFIFPSKGEGFGIPIIEAASFGLPCVVTESTALTELKEDYIGLSFKKNSYDDFLQKIIIIINNINKYKQNSKNNMENVQKKFTWENTAYDFLQSSINIL